MSQPAPPAPRRRPQPRRAGRPRGGRAGLVGRRGRRPRAGSETLTITVDGRPVEVARGSASPTAAGCTSAPLRPAACVLAYDAEVTGRAEPATVDPVDDIVYRRPSRYAESDELGPTAWAEFSQLEGKDAARRRQLVGRHPALLRQRLQPTHRRRHPDPAGPPGRLPRLRPPGDRDAARPQRAGPPGRGLRARACRRWTSTPWSRPRSTAAGTPSTPPPWRPAATLVRIATGRDASDTAFLTVQSGRADLVTMRSTPRPAGPARRRPHPPRRPRRSRSGHAPAPAPEQRPA